MPAVVCVACLKFLRVKRNGVTVEEGMPTRQPDGSDVWGPYKLWAADLYECEGCGVQIVTGFGRRPLAEHYEPNYTAARAAHSPIGRVDNGGGVSP